MAQCSTRSRSRRCCRNDHFSVDGTLIEAWASMKAPRKLPLLEVLTILLVDIIGYILPQMPMTCRQRQ